MRIKVGYLPAGETAVLDIQLVQTMNIYGGAYQYKLPFGLYPDYDKHRGQNLQEYDFDFTATINSSKRIGMISAPLNS